MTGHVTVSDLDAGAAAMVCESLLGNLDPDSLVLVDLAAIRSVEMEAQGVLAFLLQRALRIPGVELLLVMPHRLQRVLETTILRHVLHDARVKVYERREDAAAYARSAGASRGTGTG